MASIKHIFGIWIVAAVVPALVACAQGTGGISDDDDDDDVVDAKRIDATPGIDAPTDARVIDAPLPIDAPIIAIDASPGTVPTGGDCTVSTECAVAGDCCLFGEFVCMPGMEPFPGFCIPV
jgi:hypothetical protein